MATIITILIAGIIFIIGMLAYSSNANKRKQHLTIKKTLAEIADEHRLEWSHTEIDGRRAIAWSVPKQLLFFMDTSKAEHYKQLVPMDRVRKLGIAKDYFSVSGEKNRAAMQNISNISLNMTLNDNTSVSLPMYNEHTDGVYEKIRLAEKARHLLENLSKTFTHDRTAQ